MVNVIHQLSLSLPNRVLNKDIGTAITKDFKAAMRAIKSQQTLLSKPLQQKPQFNVYLRKNEGDGQMKSWTKRGKVAKKGTVLACSSRDLYMAVPCCYDLFG